MCCICTGRRSSTSVVARFAQWTIAIVLALDVSVTHRDGGL